MKSILTFVSPAALALLVSLAGCRQPQPEAPAALTAEDVAAVSKAIDSAIEAYAAKDLERLMSVYAADAVESEYDRYYPGVDEIREKHMKPEFADFTVSTYKAADRLVRGRNGLAYVSDRDIFESQDKDGNTYSTDSARASFVFEKQPDGAWKCVLSHWSGPMNWAPKKPEKAAQKK